MGNSFNQAINLLPLMVGCFIASIIVRYSLRIVSVSITDEVRLTCATSLSSRTRVASFRNAVLQRDQRCIITGRQVVLAHVSRWRGFEATHIFPLAYGRQWNDFNYSHLVTIPPANESHRSISPLYYRTIIPCHKTLQTI